MKKTIIAEKNSTKVVFSLPKEALEGVSIVSIVGDFTEWNPVMLKAKKDGSFEIELEVPNGRDYHFRYQINNHHWQNDYAADRYETSPMYPHIENSVLSLPSVENPAKAANTAKATAPKVATSAKASPPKASSTVKASPAKAPKVADAKPDDLTKIEGIGPKIASLLKADGIETFEKLSKSSEKTLKAILVKAGSRFQIHNPSTWAAQAKIAAKGDWKALKKMQDELNGGRVV
jgi:predicted flap endonuclease-1-like 5' DNA nuclease